MDVTGEILLGLMVAVAALATVARLLDQPYPILLVLGGLGLGFVPGLPDVELDPDLVLVLVLPPLLYSAAFFSSLRDLRAHLRPITMLAVGLVVLTTCLVALVAHAIIPGLPWAAAFVLGAVVAPTDPLAATTIARRLGVPRSLVTVIEGESLINDGTALTAYRFAVVAAVGGSVSLSELGLQFFVDVAGGIAVGLAGAFVVGEIRRRLDDPPVEVTISLATGYAVYLPAEQLGLSGVLAAVSAGIYLGWLAPDIASARMRMQGTAVWETLTFLLNAVLFMLVGLQLPIVLDGLDSRSVGELIAYAGAICATVVGARLLWLNTTPYVIRALDRRQSQRERRRGWQERLVIGWAGMRGSVSLAAALAIPLETDAGAPFPGRDLIVFLAFCVILFTLVVQGLTLPALIRRLGTEDDDGEQREELAARVAAAEAALERLAELEGEDWTNEDTVERTRGMHRYRIRRFQARRDGDGSEGIEERSQAYQQLTRELLVAQQVALVRMRKSGEISDEVMRKVQRDLDLEDTRLEI